MSVIRILAENLHDSATLNVTSAQMPVEYTQRSERPYVWRSADRQPQVMTVTLDQAAYIDCVAIARHNLGANGRLQIELLRNGSVVHDSGAVSMAMLIPAGLWRAGIDAWGATYNEKLPGGSELGIYWLTVPVAADSYRLTISTASVDTSGYFQIGRIFSGLSFSPSVNMDWNVRVSWSEPGQHKETEGGSLRTIGRGDKRRIFSFRLSWVSETDRQTLITHLVNAGVGSDLLVSLYPESGGLKELEHTIVCRRDPGFSHEHTFYNNWQTALSFREV